MSPLPTIFEFQCPEDLQEHPTWLGINSRLLACSKYSKAAKLGETWSRTYADLIHPSKIFFGGGVLTFILEKEHSDMQSSTCSLKCHKQWHSPVAFMCIFWIHAGYWPTRPHQANSFRAVGQAVSPVTDGFCTPTLLASFTQDCRRKKLLCSLTCQRPTVCEPDSAKTGRGPAHQESP